MRASSLSFSQSHSSSSSSSHKALPPRSSSISRDLSKLRIRDSLSSSSSASTTRPGSLSASSLSSVTSSFNPPPRKLTLTSSSSPSQTASPPTRSASTSLTSSPAPSLTASRRRLSVLDAALSSPKPFDEQKTSPTPPVAPNAGEKKTVMRRRLSVMNGSEGGGHPDGLPDPKQSKEGKLRSARSPTSAASAPSSTTLLPSIAPRGKLLVHATSSSLSTASSTSPHSSSSPVHRTFSHYASLSKVGYIPYNPAKVNQDRAVELVRFNNSDSQALFAVFDGHGALGHDVSTFLTHEIPRQICRHLPPTHAGSEVHGGLSKAFLDANVQLVQSSRIDCTFSGSTGVVCWLTGRRIYTCNVGDSRAVLARRSPPSSLRPFTAHALSTDQKPDRPDERKRIIEARGRVESCKGPKGEDIGPARVWLSTQDVPGLAMSRSFGDLIAASVGVVARPEVDEREVGEDDAFMVLGSDGVWEFMSNEEVVELVGRVGGAGGERAEEAAKAVVEEATRRWNREEEVVDDITCIIVFF